MNAVTLLFRRYKTRTTGKGKRSQRVGKTRSSREVAVSESRLRIHTQWALSDTTASGETQSSVLESGQVQRREDAVIF